MPPQYFHLLRVMPSTRRYYLAKEMAARRRAEWGRKLYEEALASKLERELSEDESASGEESDDGETVGMGERRKGVREGSEKKAGEDSKRRRSASEKVEEGEKLKEKGKKRSTK